MEKISELMDGELDSHEASLHLKRLKEDPTLRENWDLYHLVGDALRQDGRLSTRITRGISARLEQEPTVMAPRYTAPSRVSRFALSAAAGVAGLFVVGWLAVSGLPGGAPAQQVAQSPVPAQQVAKAPEPVLAQSTSAPATDIEVDDYLLAHQAASDFRALHGASLYVRPVATGAGE